MASNSSLIAQNDQVIVQSPENGSIVIDPSSDQVTVVVVTPTPTLTPTPIPAPPTKTSTNICPRDQNGARFSQLCNLGFSGNTFGNIVSVIFILAVLLSLIFLIWGGFKWVLSGGDKGKIDGARSTIVAALVGLIVVFLSYFIINLVVPIFIPGFSLQSLQLPSLY